MISITITDPNKTDVGELRAVADLLLTFANRDGTQTTFPTIHEDDNPAKGAVIPPVVAQNPHVPPPPPAPPVPVNPAEVFKAPLPNVPNVSAPANAPAPALNTNLAPPPPPASNAVELDVNGLPWDMRIHSSGKAKVENGSWKKKRNVDPVTVHNVEDELRRVMALPPAQPAAPNPVENWPFAKTYGDLNAPPPPAADNGSVYTNFVLKVTGALAASTLTPVRVSEVLMKQGIPALPLLSGRPDLIPVIDAELFPTGA